MYVKKRRVLASDSTFLASNRSDLFPARAMTIFGLPNGTKKKGVKTGMARKVKGLRRKTNR